MIKIGIILAIANGKIYRSSDKGKSLKMIHIIEHGRTPLTQAITDDDHNIYYGEYYSNPTREAVRIFKSTNKGNSWSPCFIFPKGSIRHIHAVQYDPISNLIWVATGDSDKECQIAYSENGGETFTKIGGGSQKWRTVSLIFTQNHVYWGTDNPYGHNYIYQWKRVNSSLKKIAPVKGPVYYSKKVGDELLFSTAVESGEGDQDGYARIYNIDRELNCKVLYKMKKDHWNPVLFGYGWFEFARGVTKENYVWVTTKGLIGGKRSILFRLKV